MSLVISGTPWDIYQVSGIDVHVKREDLCCPFPGPSFSKIRGVEQHIKNKLESDFPPDHFGVVDTIHSKAGWGVAWVCNLLRVPCTVYYPVLKSEGTYDQGGHELREYQNVAQQLGASLEPMKATMSAVLYNQAKKDFKSKYPMGDFLPNGLKLQESKEATEKELYFNLPLGLGQTGTWVVSVSSGTIAEGVAAALGKLKFKGEMFAHFGYSHNPNKIVNRLKKASSNAFPLIYIDQGYEYKDKAVNTKAPFPCNPYYDLKAWKWLTQNIEKLKQPIVFWNIGA